MHTDEKNCLRRLEEGQLWKVEHGYVWIVELGQQLIRYKMLRQPSARAAITHIIRVEALLNFLKQTEAELVCHDDTAKLGLVGLAA